MKDFLEAINYRITGGSEYQWDCFGDNARYLDCESDPINLYSVLCVFDSKTQMIYTMEAWDYGNDRVYRWIHPDYLTAFKQTCREYNVGFKEASDSLEYTDLEVVEDFYAKAKAIIAGEDYDTRVSIPVDFTDEELLTYMKAAHDRDMTFNQFVEEALQCALESFEADPEGFKRRAESFFNENSTSK